MSETQRLRHAAWSAVLALEHAAAISGSENAGHFEAQADELRAALREAQTVCPNCLRPAISRNAHVSCVGPDGELLHAFRYVCERAPRFEDPVDPAERVLLYGEAAPQPARVAKELPDGPARSALRYAEILAEQREARGLLQLAERMRSVIRQAREEFLARSRPPVPLPGAEP